MRSSQRGWPQYQGWYDRKAVTAKLRYLQMRGFSVVAGGLVPVLVNISSEVYLLGVPRHPGRCYRHKPSGGGKGFFGECFAL